ncbi:MAG: SDR family NAD(P)-dependent oxidoreductase [Chloroflexota bacterium]|nr:SDR family NAD(P)-dependent oxidoreductase [Chloroflexota bacterium]
MVTGGARGIGRGIACALAEEGARIAVADLPATDADRQETIAEIKRLGSDALAVDVDVRDFAQVQAMVEAARAKWGRLDILVNNAGVIAIGPVVAFAEEDWDRVMDVNLKGTFLCSKAVGPHLMQQRSGRIINLSSIAGKKGRAGSSCYSATKFGIIGFTQALAHEMAPFDVTVNAICPGEVNTYMWREVLSPAIGAMAGVSADEAFEGFIKTQVPMGRPQTVEDMGQAAVFLCRADNITGIALNVNGGTEMA